LRADYAEASAFFLSQKVLRHSLVIDAMKMEVAMRVIRFSLSLLAAAILGAAASPSAEAQDRVAAGLLTCGVKGGISFIFGSTKELRCFFSQGPSDPGVRYEGKIEKVGLDIGITDRAILTWTVLAPTSRVEADTLTGKYYGLAADASVGVGGGANVLVGGSNRTISLQPVSVQGQTGLNAALTVAQVELFPFYEGK
jgi:hypothetical protein